jgi:5-methylcytosine-specific restriction protein A
VDPDLFRRVSREHLLGAIDDLDAGRLHPFGPSTKYDVLFRGRRYAPKAVVGIAIARLAGDIPPRYSFKGGLGTACFTALRRCGFVIASKDNLDRLPEELDSSAVYIEGAVLQTLVNRYERDKDARAKCIEHYGCVCLVCGFDFLVKYGLIGNGFIHVHHIVPLSDVRKSYEVDPVADLRPVCANCHAMLHRGEQTLSIDELKRQLMR